MASISEHHPGPDGQSSGGPAAWPPAAWRCALTPDHSWALIYDDQRRNIAEIHRPLLPTGPEDSEPLAFDQIVLLMRSAPQLAALLQEAIGPGFAGEHDGCHCREGLRARARAKLRLLSMLPAAGGARPARPELLARLAEGDRFRFASDPAEPVFSRVHAGCADLRSGTVKAFHPAQLVYPVCPVDDGRERGRAFLR